MNRAIFLAVFLLIALGGGEVLAQQAQQQPTSEAQSVVRPGDVLEIRVWPDSSLSGSYLVEESYEVYFPMIGLVNVLGRSGQEIREELVERYSVIMNSPVVVLVPRFHVNLFGAVRVPGAYAVDATTTFVDLIARSGGFADNAKTEDIRLVREGQVFQINGETSLESNEARPIYLRSRDRIIVPKKGGGSSFQWLQMIVQVASLTVGILALSK